MLEEPHSRRGARTPLSVALLLPIGFHEHGNRLGFFLLQSCVNGGELLRCQLMEIFDDIFQFVRQRIRARRLVVRGTPLITVDIAVKLAKKFADAFFSGNHAAFFGGHNF